MTTDVFRKIKIKKDIAQLFHTHGEPRAGLTGLSRIKKPPCETTDFSTREACVSDEVKGQMPDYFKAVVGGRLKCRILLFEF